MFCWDTFTGIPGYAIEMLLTERMDCALEADIDLIRSDRSS